MKRFVNLFLILFLIYLFNPMSVNAQRGCCSHHGGVAGCGSNGRQICADGTYSPSCTCTPTVTYVYGCTDSKAKNYNSRANKDNGSCVYYKEGCTDEDAKNYDEFAEKDDGSCEYYVLGCTDKTAKNYDENAEKDDDSCEYYIFGCTDKDAINYNESAEKDDGSCEFESETSSGAEGILSLLTLGGIGTGVYLYKKRN